MLRIKIWPLIAIPMLTVTLNMGYATEMPAASDVPRVREYQETPMPTEMEAALPDDAARVEQEAEREQLSEFDRWLIQILGEDVGEHVPEEAAHEVIVRRLALSNNLQAMLKGDGTVTISSLMDEVAVEEALGGASDWQGWSNLVQVAVGRDHVVGLTRDGAVVGTGVNHGQLDCVGLTGVRQIVAGEERTACVMDDGRVCAFGHFGEAQGALSQIEGAKAMALSETHVIVLMQDGTAQAFGIVQDARPEGCQVEEWSNLKQVDAGYEYTVGVREDGIVLYAGAADGMVDQCASWRGMEAVAAGNGYILGLKNNRSVIKAGNPALRFVQVEDWKHMVELGAGYRQCFGIDWRGNLIRVGD